MGKPSSQTTFEDELLRTPLSSAGPYATKLSDDTRTVVAHGTTPEESQLRASQLWQTREKQIADASERKVEEGLKVAFEELVLAWSSETAHLSSPMKVIAHPAYRQIIGLGPAVLPLLLRDLARRYLPESVWNRPKHGFSVPLRELFNGAWRARCEDAVHRTAEIAPFLDAAAVGNLWRAARAGHGSRRLAYTFVVLLLWLEQHRLDT